MISKKVKRVIVLPPFEGTHWDKFKKVGIPPHIIFEGQICEVVRMENDITLGPTMYDKYTMNPICELNYFRLEDNRLAGASKTKNCNDLEIKELARKIKIDKILEQK